jgi:hypothetical protein
LLGGGDTKKTLEAVQLICISLADLVAADRHGRVQSPGNITVVHNVLYHTYCTFSPNVPLRREKASSWRCESPSPPPRAAKFPAENVICTVSTSSVSLSWIECVWLKHQRLASAVGGNTKKTLEAVQLTCISLWQNKLLRCHAYDLVMAADRHGRMQCNPQAT